MQEADKCSDESEPRTKLNSSTLSQLRQLHKSQKKKTFKCSMCDNEYGSKQKLMYHMMAHTGERPFKCTVQGCGKEFKLGQFLRKHVQSKHSNERPFNCKFPGCHYAAKRAYALAAHMRVHRDDRPFPCPRTECNFRAKVRALIRRHVKSVHDEAKNLECSICDYRTARGDSLKFHMSRHSLRNDFKCSHPQCDKSFKSPNELRRHFSNRHEDRAIKCDHPDCVNTFANALGLRRHKQYVHADKKLTCPNLDCSYRTNHAASLRKHVTVHSTQIKKISCPIEGCEYKGKNSRLVEEQVQRHETLIKCPVSGCFRFAFTKKALKNHMKLHNPSGRPFQCLLCSKRYQSRGHLDTHTAAHTKERPFGCGHCNSGFSSRSHIKRHVSSVHANHKFPFSILPLNERECLRCKVTLPLEEFRVHYMGHMVPVVVNERLALISF